MFRKGFIFACLLVASLVAMTTVHACELPGVVTLECSGTVHVEPDNDSDPASGESGKGTVHHHGCHAASTFMAGSTVTDVISAPSRSYPVLHATAPLPRESDPGLRPPIA